MFLMELDVHDFLVSWLIFVFLEKFLPFNVTVIQEFESNMYDGFFFMKVFIQIRTITS